MPLHKSKSLELAEIHLGTDYVDMTESVRLFVGL